MSQGLEASNTVNVGLAGSIYEDINDKYGYGNLGDIKVVIRRKDGWINGSKLASLKRKKDGEPVPDALHTYKRIDKTKEIINKFTQESDPGVNLFQEVTKTDLKNQNLSRDDMNIIQGTYVPSLIGIDIAAWVSVTYYIKMLKIVEDYTNRESRIKIRLLQVEKGELKEKNLSLEEKIELMRKENNEALASIKKEGSENAARLEYVIGQNNALNKKVDKIYDLIKNVGDSKECIYIYKSGADNGYYIRAGLRRGLQSQYKLNGETEMICYNNISNAKRALKEAKAAGYVPKQKESLYKLSESEYGDIIAIFKGINDKYLENAKEDS